MIRTYSELIQLKTFQERFEYLKIGGSIGEMTFNSQRYLNQRFYNSKDWEYIKRDVIIRDESCDLAIKDLDIVRFILVHHMNPLTIEDFKNMTKYVRDPEYLITTSFKTHKAIHYGLEIYNPYLIVRKQNDTCPWKEESYVR